MRSLLRITLISLAFLGATACQPSTKDEDFQAMFRDVPMKQALHFWTPSQRFQIGQPISLDLENSSKDEIGVSVQDGIFAFVFRDGRWGSLTNSAYYIPADAMQLFPPKHPGPPSVGGIELVPVLDNQGQVVNVRVVVIGSVYSDGQKTSRRAGAFIDVAMKP